MPRLGLSTVMVLKAIAEGCSYGFDIMELTGLKSGTVYPALSRLRDLGYVQSSWEDAEQAHRETRPPRRYYVITSDGEVALDEFIKRHRWLRDGLVRNET